MQTGLCEQHNSALVVIDVQSGLTNSMPLKVLARLQRNIGLLIKASAILDIPVLASERESEKMGPIEGDVSKLLPAETRVYNKTSYSCIGADNFLDDLNATGRKQIILSGMEAHISVLQTAIQLSERGFQVFIVADAVCSRQRESYETGLQRLKQSGAILCDAESVLCEWLRGAEHEHYSTVQGLMR